MIDFVDIYVNGIFCQFADEKFKDSEKHTKKIMLKSIDAYLAHKQNQCYFEKWDGKLD